MTRAAVGVLLVVLVLNAPVARPRSAVAQGAGPAIPGLAGQGELQAHPQIEEYSIDPRTIEHLTPQQRSVIDWYGRYITELRASYARVTQVEEIYSAQGKDSSELGRTRRELDVCIRRAPTLADSYDQGGSSGFIPLYLYRIRDYVTNGPFTAFCAPHLKEIRARLPVWEREVKDARERREREGIRGAAGEERPRGAAWDSYSVFLAGRDVFVGQLSSLELVPLCQLKGWGRDCDTRLKNTQKLKRISPPFEAYEQAQAHYCAAMQGIVDPKNPRNNSPREVLLTGGRDHEAKFSGEGFDGDYYYIRNAPACPKKTVGGGVQ
jgi:hypothetical protein